MIKPMNNIILSTAYFPPIQYMSKIFRNDNVLIEKWENFGKQSYRNRAKIMISNGIMQLVVPVEKANSKILTKDIKITYVTNWQKIHFRSIESAYRNSPYYEYYIDDLMPFFEYKEKFLLDFNLKILEVLMNLIDINNNIKLSSYFTVPKINNIVLAENKEYYDLRNGIHPKVSKQIEDKDFIIKEYHQTFNDRMPFTPNLSILDLLFCEGPNSLSYL